MTTIYLIRHAQADGNLYRRCQGWYNGLITPKGYLQIQALSRRFQDIEIHAVYSSDLFRTMTTARAILHSRALSLRVDPELREIGGGCWEDHAWGELIHQDPAGMAAFLNCDPGWHVTGSETYPHVRARMQAAVERIAAAHPGQTVAVFSHGSAIRAGLSAWLNTPVEHMGELPLGDNTSVAKLEYDGGQMRVCYYHDASHLGDLAGAVLHASSSGAEKVAAMARTSLYFVPLRLPDQKELYLAARREGWMASHGTMDCFDGDAFLSAAQRSYDFDPESVLIAMCQDRPVGMLHLDFQQQAQQRVGRVPFFYMMPEYRSKGLGVQLLGQAVSAFRARGRQYLRLRCAPENDRAKKFYQRHGFYKIGEEPGGIGHLDTMEKYIGYVLG